MINNNIVQKIERATFCNQYNCMPIIIKYK